MIAKPKVHLDRRHRRRQESVEQVLEVAVAVMVEHGVAGLSLGEVARRMGIRPPSLYVYYASKNAIYDAIFARGSDELMLTMEPLYARVDTAPDLAKFLLEFGEVFVRWAVEHPAYSQLMFWRPVPKYEPSASAYRPAFELLSRARTVFQTLKERGLFRPDVDVDDALRAWTTVTSGVMTQQLANAPHELFEEGAFTIQLPELTTMFLAHYGPAT